MTVVVQLESRSVERPREEVPECRRGLFYGKTRLWVAKDTKRASTGTGRTRRAAIANLTADELRADPHL